MADIKSFLLPDLGEGLPDAEIVEWHVNVGDKIELDEPLISMETAKAVVDVPSPFTGTLVKQYGEAGDVIITGTPLADFEIDPEGRQRSAGQDTGHSHGHAAPEPAAAEPAKPEAPAPTAPSEGKEREDAGTVVGAMQSSNEVHVEQVSSAGGVKAVPAVRALAKKMKIDLTRVQGTGKDGVITLKDVRAAAERGDAALSSKPAPVRAAAAPAPSPARPAPAPAASRAAPAKAQADVAFDVDEPIRGVRRNMVRSMAKAHAEVVATTLMDDADIHAWAKGEDITARVIRAIVRASEAEPALNAWLNAEESRLRRHSRVDVGIAVDSPDGLFVASLRNAERLDPQGVRAGINRIRDGVKNRSLPPEELKDYTIMLSNFGVFAGKYATPVVVPPCVAIIATGRLYHEVVPVIGGLETHRLMPLSITFDHRAATGGEAARFMKALIDDLQRAK